MICNECKEVFEPDTPEREKILGRWENQGYDRFTCTPCVVSFNEDLRDWHQSEEGRKREAEWQSDFCLGMSCHPKCSVHRKDNNTLGELLVALRSLSNEEFAAVNRDLMDTKGESK